jgi:hypothetical protein
MDIPKHKYVGIQKFAGRWYQTNIFSGPKWVLD